MRYVHSMNLRMALVMCAAATLAAGTASAKTDFSRFPLLKAAPADAFVTVAAKANPERAYLDEYWKGVTTAFMDSGILQDVWDLVTDAMSDETLEQVEEIQDQFSTLCGQVDWGSLFSQEMLHVGRMTMPQGPISSMYEGVMLGRMDAKSAAANYKSLKGILTQIVALVDSRAGEGIVRLVEEEKDGVFIAGIVPAGATGPMLSVGHCKDVIAISFGGGGILPECMELLYGKGDKKGLASTARFQRAFDDLPPAEDELSFVDLSQMFGKVNSFLKMISGQIGQGRPAPAAPSKKEGSAGGNSGKTEKPGKAPAPKGGSMDEEDGDAAAPGGSDGGEDEARHVLTAIIKVLDDVAIVDHVAAVQWSDGYRVFTQQATTLCDKASASPLHSVFAVNPTFGDFDRLVPKEATNFSCTSGMNFAAFYDYVHAFVEESIPGGAEMCKEFMRMQEEEWELNIRKDVLGLLTGSMMSVEVGSDWAIMLGVTDEKAARTLVEDLIGRLNNVLGPEQSVRISPTKIMDGVEFIQISHPMMMMMGSLSPPVVGCAEGRLVLASNASVVKKCIQTARGKHAGISKNKRFMKEGLVPAAGEKIDSISFTDETKTAEHLQAACGGIAMAMGFATMGAQDAPPQVRSILQAIPPIVSKLGTVVGKLNFYQSSASYSTFDGRRWMTKEVQNYKDPKEMEEAEPSAPGPDGKDAESDDE